MTNNIIRNANIVEAIVSHWYDGTFIYNFAIRGIEEEETNQEYYDMICNTIIAMHGSRIDSIEYTVHTIVGKSHYTIHKEY